MGRMKTHINEMENKIHVPNHQPVDNCGKSPCY
jgi:hypothetical protein